MRYQVCSTAAGGGSLGLSLPRSGAGTCYEHRRRWNRLRGIGQRHLFGRDGQRRDLRRLRSEEDRRPQSRAYPDLRAGTGGTGGAKRRRWAVAIHHRSALGGQERRGCCSSPWALPRPTTSSVDLSALWAVVEQIGPHIVPECIVVCKSTVPVGTNAKLAARLKELTGREVDVASNPEFLKEGMAIDDFMKPDRVVIGARRQEVIEVLADLYQPYLRTDKPLLAMSPESAEMTKYAANALLSTKISFINEMANLCECVGADVNEVRRGIGPRQPHRLRLSVSRRRLRRKLLSEGRSRAGGRPRGSTASSRACWKRSTRSTSGRRTLLVEKIERHFEGQALRQGDRRLGPARSSPAPTTSVRRRRWC